MLSEGLVLNLKQNTYNLLSFTTKLTLIWWLDKGFKSFQRHTPDQTKFKFPPWLQTWAWKTHQSSSWLIELNYSTSILMKVCLCARQPNQCSQCEINEEAFKGFYLYILVMFQNKTSEMLNMQMHLGIPVCSYTPC